MGMLSKLIDNTIAAINPVRAVQRAQARKMLKRWNSYDASKKTEIFRNFQSSGLSANADLEGSIETLRHRSRQAYRNYPAARAGIEARVGIVVATGIDLEPNTGDEVQDAKLREVWRMFEEIVDAAGLLHFKEQQRQAFRCTGLNGGALFQIVTLKDKSRLIPLALHAFEADQLSVDPLVKIPDNHSFSNGVESDQFGRPVFYHVLDKIDEAYGIKTKAAATGKRIAAKDIIHIFEQLRPKQSIGEPILVPALKRMVQEEELVEAELESAKIGSAFAVAILSKSDMAGDFNTKESDSDEEETTDDAGNEMTTITSGAVARLNEDEDIKVINNTRPSQAIAPFRDMLRGDISSSLQISRTDLDKDYSKANYSSMRAAMLDKKRLLTPVQNWFGRALVSRLYLRALPLLAVVAGIELAKEGTLERARQERHKLVPDGWAYVDPEKDIGAALMAIEGGLSTYRDEIGQRGNDYREIHEQLAKEIKNPLIKTLMNLFKVDDTKQPATDGSQKTGKKTKNNEDDADAD